MLSLLVIYSELKPTATYAMQGQPGGFNRMGGMGGRGRGGRGQPRPLAPGSDRIINVPKASIRVVTSIAGMDLANKIVRP